jgi:hypothetical protein
MGCGRLIVGSLCGFASRSGACEDLFNFGVGEDPARQQRIGEPPDRRFVLAHERERSGP